jgi:branched-chain amino acid transport system ATP-binding protein
MRPLLRLRNVEARYGRLVALSNVSLVVPEGSVVALLGPNGVGKSTMLRTISGMLKPAAGEIWFDGRRIDGLGDHVIARRGLAHIPEGRGIFPGLTVRENLLLAAFSGRPNTEEVFGLFPVLEHRLDQVAGTLSGGEQQMLSLSRALINRPRLLLVDELSLGLAPILVAQLFSTLEKIRDAGTTILLVEQYVRYAMRFADIIAVMHKGKVAFLGEPGELAHEERLVEAYLGTTQAESATDTAEEVSEAATSGARRTRTRAAPRATNRRSSRA